MQTWRKIALPKSRRGQAAGYYFNHQTKLEAIYARGDVRIDNNSVENAIRPCALGRKNYLFIGTPEAGQRAAILYTLIASARRRGHNPQEYLKDVLRQLEQNQEAARAITNKNYQDNPLRQLAETLTPENWTQPK